MSAFILSNQICECGCHETAHYADPFQSAKDHGFIEVQACVLFWLCGCKEFKLAEPASPAQGAGAEEA